MTEVCCVFRGYAALGGNIGFYYHDDRKTPRCALSWASRYYHVLSLFFTSPHTPITFCFTFISTMAAQLYKTASGRLFHAGAVAIITVG